MAAPVIQGRTRAQLRASVGYNLGAGFYSSTTSSLGLSTTVVDTTLAGADDEYNGRWVLLTSGDYSGQVRRVSDYTASSGTLTVAPAFGGAVASGVTYELWPEDHHPGHIHDFINQAIISATGKVYDPEEDVSLHGDGETTRFDIPTDLAMLTGIEYRYSVPALVLHDCEVVFDESVDADFTVSLDAEDKKYGSNSVKFVIAGTVSLGNIASDSISSADLRAYTHIEFWAKVVTTVVSDDLRLRLSATVNGGTETESLAIPALTANIWTFVRIALANPRSDSAIISIALEYNANPGANTIWLDDIQAVKADRATWTRLDDHLWDIDHEARDIVFQNGGESFVGYSLLKLIGGDKPALLTVDATANEIPDDYVIAEATGLAYLQQGEYQRASYWMGVAKRAMASFPMLVNVRPV